MAISFSDIPGDMLVPLFYAELQPAPTAAPANLRMLLMGQRNLNWTQSTQPDYAGADYKPYILNDALVQSLFGNGSQLHHMYRVARKNNPFGEIWGMSMKDDTSTDDQAVAATATIGIRAVPAVHVKTQSVLKFFIAGTPVSVVVYPTDTRETLAQRMAGRIAGMTVNGVRLPVTALIEETTPDIVTLRCRWRGGSGNHIRVHSDVYGGEGDLLTRKMLQLPGRLTGGLLGGNLREGLFSLGDESFDVYVVGTTTTVTGNLTPLDEYLTEAWSPMRQNYGHGFAAFDIDYADAITYGSVRNGPHVSFMHTYNSPSPPWEWASALAGRAAAHWANPPELSRPLHTLNLAGILPPPSSVNWPDISDRQALLEAGVSTWTVDRDSQTVRINRVVTTYQTNVWGDDDASWRDAVTMFQAQYFARYMRSAITGTYPRAALTTRETGITGFASPPQIRDTLIHAYTRLAALGVVENVDGFMLGLVVQRNDIDANRVDILIRADMVNQLRVVATLIETHLELNQDGLSGLGLPTVVAA